MIDRRTQVMSWLEGLTFDDWPMFHSDSEVQEIAKAAFALMEEQEPLEPTRVKIDQAGPSYHRCYCKKCGHHVGNMIRNKVAKVHENYCSCCGQEVKWE